MLALEVRRSIEGEGSVEAIVLQPRSPDPVREHTWTNEELRALRDRLLATARAPPAPRLHLRGRRALQVVLPPPACCPALAAAAGDAAAAAIAPPQLVASGEFSQEHLDQLLELAPALEHLVRQARVAAKRYLLSGGRLEHQKLVQKRGGGVTVVDRADPRAEIDVPAVLESARQSMEANRLQSAMPK